MKDELDFRVEGTGNLNAGKDFGVQSFAVGSLSEEETGKAAYYVEERKIIPGTHSRRNRHLRAEHLRARRASARTGDATLVAGRSAVVRRTQSGSRSDTGTGKSFGVTAAQTSWQRLADVRSPAAAYELSASRDAAGFEQNLSVKGSVWLTNALKVSEAAWIISISLSSSRGFASRRAGRWSVRRASDAAD